MLHRSTPTESPPAKHRTATRRPERDPQRGERGRTSSEDDSTNDGWVTEPTQHDADESALRPSLFVREPSHCDAEDPIPHRSLFAAGLPDEETERPSPFGCDAWAESDVTGTAAETARELAALTGESVAEAVETALAERLARYRLESVGIAERLERLAHDVSELQTADECPTSDQASTAEQATTVGQSPTSEHPPTPDDRKRPWSLDLVR